MELGRVEGRYLPHMRHLLCPIDDFRHLGVWTQFLNIHQKSERRKTTGTKRVPQSRQNRSGRTLIPCPNFVSTCHPFAREEQKKEISNLPSAQITTSASYFTPSLVVTLGAFQSYPETGAPMTISMPSSLAFFSRTICTSALCICQSGYPICFAFSW